MQMYCIYFLVLQLFLQYNAAICNVKAGCIPQPCSCDEESTKKCTKSALTGTCEFPVLKPMDCEQLLRLGYNKSGVYDIWPNNKIMNNRPIRVYCDMKTDNGGWTVIQRRGNFLRPVDYFHKNWTNYKNGFGNIEEEFWLGNDNIFALTNQREYSVRFDLTDMTGNHRYALYDVFFIENEENKYRLTIQEYSGTANDSMTNPNTKVGSHNGQNFTTKDQHNGLSKSNCAQTYKGGGWWYSKCYMANLNGLNLRGQHESSDGGINWHYWKGSGYSLAKTEIKIRPKNFSKSLRL